MCRANKDVTWSCDVDQSQEKLGRTCLNLLHVSACTEGCVNVERVLRDRWKNGRLTQRWPDTRVHPSQNLGFRGADGHRARKPQTPRRKMSSCTDTCGTARAIRQVWCATSRVTCFSLWSAESGFLTQKQELAQYSRIPCQCTTVEMNGWMTRSRQETLSPLVLLVNTRPSKT